MHAEEKHIVEFKVLFKVLIALFVLTGLTVLAGNIDLGYFNVVVALLIATAKASLVVFFFMHLKYEGGLFKIMVLLAFVILAIFIGFTFFDVAFRAN
ncbi:cytochrome C oxidase subunit IV family protein [Flexistipes sinusarabici]|uniref:cytochrome C oxidase subunit IV family protein n=1 Tax=Flexistipes sinusarabici TaxID=2352 RepID=UPI002356490A|nr:cytochrome C oxidase subunit IV family protein [Flexistipes sinusarabici]